MKIYTTLTFDEIALICKLMNCYKPENDGEKEEMSSLYKKLKIDIDEMIKITQEKFLNKEG